VFSPAQRGLGSLYSQAVGRPGQSGLLKTLWRKLFVRCICKDGKLDAQGSLSHLVVKFVVVFSVVM